MSTLLSRLRLPGLVLCALLSASCIDIREEFWIHDDGSAKAEITCEMPSTATIAVGGKPGIEALADKLLSHETCIDSHDVRVTTRQDRTTLRIRVHVDNLMSLERLSASIKRHRELPQAVRRMVGTFDVSMAGPGSIKVSRTVSPGEAAPALRWMPASKLKGHKLVKIMHFPRRIRDSNAHDQWDEGRTIAWETPLAAAIATPVVYRFTLPLPIPWGWLAGGAGVLAGLVLLLLRFRKRRAGRLSVPQREDSVGS